LAPEYLHVRQVFGARRPHEVPASLSRGRESFCPTAGGSICPNVLKFFSLMKNGHALLTAWSHGDRATNPEEHKDKAFGFL